MQDFFDNYIFFIPLCCLCQRSEFSKKKTKNAFHSFWNIHYECDNVKASKKHCFFQYLYYYYNLLSLTLWHSFDSFFYYETTILFVTFVDSLTTTHFCLRSQCQHDIRKKVNVRESIISSVSNKQTKIEKRRLLENGSFQTVSFSEKGKSAVFQNSWF